jgi:hypothetical protein
MGTAPAHTHTVAVRSSEACRSGCCLWVRPRRLSLFPLPDGVVTISTVLYSCVKGLKNQSRVKLNIVRCPPVTTVLIRRPDLRYQLGFSVQNGIVSTSFPKLITTKNGDILNIFLAGSFLSSFHPIKTFGVFSSFASGHSLSLCSGWLCHQFHSSKK